MAFFSDLLSMTLRLSQYDDDGSDNEVEDEASQLTKDRECEGWWEEEVRGQNTAEHEGKNRRTKAGVSSCHGKAEKRRHVRNARPEDGIKQQTQADRDGHDSQSEGVTEYDSETNEKGRCSCARKSREADLRVVVDGNERDDTGGCDGCLSASD